MPPKGKVPLSVPVPLPLSMNPKPEGSVLVTVIVAVGTALVLTVKLNGTLAVAVFATLLVNVGADAVLARGVAAWATEGRAVAMAAPATVPTSTSTILRSMRIMSPLSDDAAGPRRPVRLRRPRRPADSSSTCRTIGPAVRPPPARPGGAGWAGPGRTSAVSRAVTRAGPACPRPPPGYHPFGRGATGVPLPQRFPATIVDRAGRPSIF